MPDTPSVSSNGSRSRAQTASRMPMLNVALVVLTVIMLSSGAVFLAQEAHTRRLARSERAATLGRESFDRNDLARAAQHFRDAVALEPGRLAYRLDLAKSLAALDRPTEAEPYLLEVLRLEPIHGEANLELARLERRRGHRAEAEQAYYRAIYGRWQPGQQALRVETRLELVSLFAESDDGGRVRIALGELAEAFPGDLALQLVVARRLLAFGFPQDAARVLEAAVERFAQPGEAITLLAEAEFTRENYRAALEAATRAIGQRRDDAKALEIRALAQRVLALDPAQPRLATRSRAARVRTLLTEVRVRLASCHETPWPAADQLWLDAAESWLEKGPRDADGVDAGYEALEALARLWRTHCAASPPPDAVDRVLARLAGDPR